jgi:two-component system sensor histidine kinase DctS
MPPPDTLARPRRLRRALLWAALVALLLVAQTLLVALTINYEAGREQDDAERAASEAASELRRELGRQTLAVQTLAFVGEHGMAWEREATELLRRSEGLQRLEWRDVRLGVVGAVDSPYPPRLFSLMPRREQALEAELACRETQRSGAPAFSRSYFVPLAGGLGVEVIDLCVPAAQAGRETAYLVATISLPRMLEAAVGGGPARRHEFSLIEADGTRLARVGGTRGGGVFVGQHVVDLPGPSLQMRADSPLRQPSLIPNFTTALVLGLSLLLFGVVILLARDGRRRAEAERALREALAFRNAMEDSLPTGLRARDLLGAISYANPAFCTMVGFAEAELRGNAGPRQPYWPPEFADDYERRQQRRLVGQGRSLTEAREGYETVFMRKNGERFPVVIYEAPLVDGEGRHAGWMSAVLDMSAQRRVEELSRQQQDRLQASARLATVGEMASLLSHELNQPLAAIASYASGSLNLLQAPDDSTPGLLHQAMSRIAEQADRAGRVIKSVHAFVRRREQQHETISVDQLFEAVMPLVRLQAHKSGVRVVLDLPGVVPSEGEPMPRVRCDRTMVEQVLLNLSRNGIQAMDAVPDLSQRVLTLGARLTHERWVTFTVSDAGTGIAPDVAAKLFTPFFSTRGEGMGLGLSLCRTVIEQHGGALDFGPGPGKLGTAFRFTLPTPRPPGARAAPEDPRADSY